MGTRSRIAVMHGTVCKSVYCHWDGYLEHNGAILQKYYNSAGANNLVALGDISSLKETIGEEHPFSVFDTDGMTQDEYYEKFGNMTTFYGRDRGEENCSWKVAYTFEEFLDQVEACGAEYYYVMQDGVWYTGCPDKGNRLVALSEALTSVKETA